MKKITILLSVFTVLSCSKNTIVSIKSNKKYSTETATVQQKTSHDYGGWYCPDNLNGFPAVDLKSWEKVPVVNGRLATKKETQNGTSLIFVDLEKYPNAKPLDINMPKLAKYYNQSSKKEETIIVIQALNIAQDSVVGFRYLNGGNGSAHLNEVTFLTDKDLKNMPNYKFVSFNVTINAPSDKIWDILTNPKYNKELQSDFYKNNALKMEITTLKKVNYNYDNAAHITSEFAADLYGNKYIQIDFEEDKYQYVEKFMLLEEKETKTIKLKIVCGPYLDNYERQKTKLVNWSQKVKELSEKN